MSGYGGFNPPRGPSGYYNSRGRGRGGSRGGFRGSSSDQNFNGPQQSSSNAPTGSGNQDQAPNITPAPSSTRRGHGRPVLGQRDTGSAAISTTGRGHGRPVLGQRATSSAALNNNGQGGGPQIGVRSRDQGDTRDLGARPERSNPATHPERFRPPPSPYVAQEDLPVGVGSMKTHWRCINCLGPRHETGDKCDLPCGTCGLLHPDSFCPQRWLSWNWYKEHARRCPMPEEVSRLSFRPTEEDLKTLRDLEPKTFNNIRTFGDLSKKRKREVETENQRLDYPALKRKCDLLEEDRAIQSSVLSRNFNRALSLAHENIRELELQLANSKPPSDLGSIIKLLQQTHEDSIRGSQTVPQGDLLHDMRQDQERSGNDGRLFAHLKSEETPAIKEEARGNAAQRQPSQAHLTGARSSDAETRPAAGSLDQAVSDEDRKNCSDSYSETRALVKKEEEE